MLNTGIYATITLLYRYREIDGKQVKTIKNTFVGNCSVCVWNVII